MVQLSENKSFKNYTPVRQKALMLLIRRRIKLSKTNVISKSALLKLQLTSSDEKRGFALRLTTETRTNVHNGAVYVRTRVVNVHGGGGFHARTGLFF